MKKNYLLHILLAITISIVAVQGASAAPSASTPNAISLSATTSADSVILHVPGDIGNLQDAINQIPDGGVIELDSGVYPSPTGGFRISNLGKSFTIRAADGAEVILDGLGSRVVMRFMNSDLSEGKPVVFQGITFANGRSSTPGLAGGLSMYHSEGTFINCTFLNNSSDLNGSGGGTLVTFNSTAFFINSTWSGNTAMANGGGLAINDYAKVYLHASTFRNNRTNVPGHTQTAAGGGIHAGNSLLRVSNSTFENNQAGYVGGGIFAIGTWSEPANQPRMDVIISSSTFMNNQAVRDPSVNFSPPTEGGAFHAEAQTTAKIFNSTFTTNRAMAGGGISIYQAEVQIKDSVFNGNQATGLGAVGGYGGAITASSNDTASDGSVNRRAAHLSIEDSLIQGRFEAVGTVAQGGGGIYAAGDINRTYGINGVSQIGSATENRATVILRNVVLNDLDVVKNPEGGVGGAIMADLTDLAILGGLIANSDALGTSNSSGGGLAIIHNSIANISDTTIAQNTSEKYGGGLFVQGSTINLDGCNLIENETINTYFGAALFSAPMVSHNLPVNGVVQDCTISNNLSLAIYDDDRTDGPINDVRYNNNRFYAGGDVNAIVYTNPIYPFGLKTVAELNSLVVTRQNGTSSPKSQVANTALSEKPTLGGLFVTPPNLQNYHSSANPVYIGYAWSGNSAYLNGQPITSEFAGTLATSEDGYHTLEVDGEQFSTEVSSAVTPSVSFTVSTDGAQTTLNWTLESGTLLDAAIDQGVSIVAAPSGSTQIPTGNDKTYCFYAITAEGGVLATVNTAVPLLYAPDSIVVLAGKNFQTYFGSVPIANSGGNNMVWTARTTTPDLIQLITTSGETLSNDSVEFTVSTAGRTPGDYIGSIDVDAGEAGFQHILLTIRIVETLHQVSLPLVVSH